MRFALIAIMISLPAAAEERQSFYGTWGTEKQCARAPFQPGVDVFAQPFEISDGWLRHGNSWCKLDWGPIEARENGLFTAAFASCSEDAVRHYLLGMELSEGALTLRWDFPHSNGPLARCPTS